MTEKELSAALSPIVALTGKAMTPEQIKAWHIMLDDLDAETVRRGVIATMRDFHFAGHPPVGLVRKNCGVGGGMITVNDRATVAWSAVKNAVSMHGGYATVVFDDPITTATVRALGGWPRICDTKAGEAFDVWLKKDFEKTYSAFITCGVSVEQTEPLAGLCDITNSATGHEERQSPLLVEIKLPATPNRLVRGEPVQKGIAQHSAVKRLANTLVDNVTSLELMEDAQREPSLSAEEQKKRLGEWVANKPCCRGPDAMSAIGRMTNENRNVNN